MDSMSMSDASLFIPSRLRELRRYLRRRLPADLVEDVAQSAACEAWAGRHNARGDGFLFGVARNEAYDAMQSRRPRALDLLCEEQSAQECSTLAHAELSEVMDYVHARPHLHDPMRWLVREHRGETFDDIAEDEGLSPAAVRQRVSRLRRELRAAFAIALTAIVLLGLIAAHRLLSHQPERAVALSPNELPDRAPGVSVEAPVTDEWLAGSWRVASTTDPRLLPFVGANVEVSDGHAEISVRGWRRDSTFTRHGSTADIGVQNRTESVTLHRRAVHGANGDTEVLRVETTFGSATLTR